MNSIKTHCFVMFETAQQAESIRSATPALRCSCRLKLTAILGLHEYLSCGRECRTFAAAMNQILKSTAATGTRHSISSGRAAARSGWRPGL